MNKIAFLFSFIALSAAHAGEKSACYKVEGMTCAACSVTIKTAVKKLDGISSIVVDPKKDSAKVIFEDQKATSVKIAQAITDAGYKATEKTCEN
jgi:copper ion binding protein